MKFNRLFTGIVFTIFLLHSNAEVVVYTSETEFLTDLAILNSPIAHEGFEDDTVWGEVRSSIVDGNHTTATLSNLGLNWTSNNQSSQITTSNGAALMGEWGFYSLPHGSYTNPDPGANCTNPEECGDGFRGDADGGGELYGIGGWIRTNTPYAKVGLFIGTYPDNRVDFGETCDTSGENCFDNAIIGTQAQFFGVIDPGGFTRFEFRELEGTAEDAKFIFADDFYFTGSNVVEPPPPSAGAFLY